MRVRGQFAVYAGCRCNHHYHSGKARQPAAPAPRRSHTATFRDSMNSRQPR